MALGKVQGAGFGAVWDALAALVDGDGSPSAPLIPMLLARGATSRDLADAVHCLCLLHGRQPGIIEHVARRSQDAAVAAWLAQAVNGFAAERAYLVRLVAASGPLPSTPGQAETEAAIASQRHALEMLAASERPGCALGAAMALVLDWTACRAVLDVAADRMGVAVPRSELPTTGDSAMLLATLPEAPAFERAAMFGAQQLLAQHRGLWSLLDARRTARDRA